MDKRKAIALLEQGKGGQVVADALGVRRQGMAGFITNHPDLMAARDRGYERIRELIESGMALSAIARETGWGETTVHQIFQRLGYRKTKKPDSSINYWLRKPWRVTA